MYIGTAQYIIFSRIQAPEIRNQFIDFDNYLNASITQRISEPDTTSSMHFFFNAIFQFCSFFAFFTILFYIISLHCHWKKSLKRGSSFDIQWWPSSHTITVNTAFPLVLVSKKLIYIFIQTIQIFAKFSFHYSVVLHSLSLSLSLSLLVKFHLSQSNWSGQFHAAVKNTTIL